MNDKIIKIINYVLHTPENTNYLVLTSLLEELIDSSSGLNNVELYIEDGNLYAIYRNTNFDFSIDKQGNLIYNISS